MNCNEIAANIAYLKSKFQSCRTLMASDMIILMDLIEAQGECATGTGTGDLTNQNNKISIARPNEVNLLSEVVGAINTTTQFEILEDEIPLVEILIDDIPHYFFIKTGKGIYGVGGQALTSNDIQLISNDFEVGNTPNLGVITTENIILDNARKVLAYSEDLVFENTTIEGTTRLRLSDRVVQLLNSIGEGGGGTVPIVDNLLSILTTSALSANQGRVLKNLIDNQQSSIDLNTAKVSNVDHPLVETAVPAGAVFTDTVYTKPINEPISYIVGLQGALDGKVDDAQVLTNVPVGALFTDTVYDDTALSGRVTTIEGFVDQDVSSGAAPILDATNFTNLPVVGDTLPLTSTIVTNTSALPSHIGGVNEVTSATDVTITIQPFATQAIPVGTVLLYSRKGAGDIIIAYSGVTGDAGIQTYAENDIIRLWHKSTNVWEALDPPQDLGAAGEPNTINSVTTGEPAGSDQVPNVVSLTQAEYDAGTPVAGTHYIITDAPTPATGPTVATSAEVNTGTDNAKFISPLALAGSQLQTDVNTNNAKVGVTTEEANTIDSVIAGEPTGATAIPNIVYMSQVDYDAAVTATTTVATTIYIVE